MRLPLTRRGIRYAIRPCLVTLAQMFALGVAQAGHHVLQPGDGGSQHCVWLTSPIPPTVAAERQRGSWTNDGILQFDDTATARCATSSLADTADWCSGSCRRSPCCSRVRSIRTRASIACPVAERRTLSTITVQTADASTGGRVRVCDQRHSMLLEGYSAGRG